MNENFLREEIDSLGLDGMTYVKSLKETCDVIPEKPGVYVVLGNYSEMPEFLIKGSGPEFNVKNGVSTAMNYPVEKLEGKWVDDTWIMYIGKTDDALRDRISTYIKFGKGKDVPHRGGRAIWQLPDSDELLIGWKIIEGKGKAAATEKEWLKDFKTRHHNQLPFANWRS